MFYDVVTGRPLVLVNGGEQRRSFTYIDDCLDALMLIIENKGGKADGKEFAKEVPAGDNFTIKMTYDARQLGHFHKMAAIKSNASEQPLYLTMKGVVLAEVLDYAGNYPLSMGTMLLDKNELEFDDVNKGDEVIQEIHVYNNGTDVMQPNLMHLPPYLTAQVVPETISPGHGAN